MPDIGTLAECSYAHRRDWVICVVGRTVAVYRDKKPRQAVMSCHVAREATQWYRRQVTDSVFCMIGGNNRVWYTDCV